MTFLRNPTPPRLPDPKEDYDPVATTELLRVLRLYFEQLNHLTQALTGRNGGQYLESPTASYYNDVVQPLAAASATPVAFPKLTNEQGFKKVSASLISADHAGTYRVHITLAVRNIHAPDELVSFWIRRNGINMPTTRTEASVASNGVMPVSLDYMLDLRPADSFEVVVFAQSAFIEMYPPPAFDPVPRGASARINISFESSDSTAFVTATTFRLKKTVFDPPP